MVYGKEELFSGLCSFAENEITSYTGPAVLNYMQSYGVDFHIQFAQQTIRLSSTYGSIA